MCDIIFSCPVIPLVSSLTFLVMIALDRTVCIAKPFWYQRHVIMRRAVLLTVTCWLFTILSPFLPLLAPYEANGDFCYPEDRVFSPANVKVGVVLFAGYAFMMTGLYFAISHIARKQARRIAVQTHSADVSIQNEAKVRNMLWRYWAFSTSAGLLKCFFTIKYLFGYHPSRVQTLEVSTERICLANSFMNPVIYVKQKKQFNTAFKLLLHITSTTQASESVTTVSVY